MIDSPHCLSLTNTQFPGSLPPFGANPDGDVLQDFDFDSFLHQDGEMGGEAFNFDAVEFDIVGTD